MSTKPDPEPTESWETWGCLEDVINDLSKLNECGEAADDLAIELNQDVWLNDSSCDSSHEGQEVNVLPIERKTHSDMSIIDKITDEINDSMRKANIYFEEDIPVKQELKTENQKPAIITQPPPKFTKKTREPRGFRVSSSQGEWTPLPREEQFTLNSENFPSLG